jgi:hypothetical protein
MTLSHRINRTRGGGHYKALTESYHHYRGLAIRSLREDLDVEHKRTGDVVLAGIVSLLLSDVSLFSSQPVIPASRGRQS